MNIRKQAVRTGMAWGVLGTCMLLTRPTELPVVLLIVPFVLLAVAFYNMWLLIGLVRIRYSNKPVAPVLHAKLGLVISVCAVLLLVLQSLGQLTVRDVVTLLAAVGLGYLYLTRSSIRLAK